MPDDSAVAPGPIEPWLDIVSYGRRGPNVPAALSSEQIAQVARTVRRTPEVMVKVSGGARDAGGAKAHFDYVGRRGKLAIETDEGREVAGRGAGAELVAEWNLDLSRGQYRPKRPARGRSAGARGSRSGRRCRGPAASSGRPRPRWRTAAGHRGRCPEGGRSIRWLPAARGFAAAGRRRRPAGTRERSGRSGRRCGRRRSGRGWPAGRGPRGGEDDGGVLVACGLEAGGQRHDGAHVAQGVRDGDVDAGGDRVGRQASHPSADILLYVGGGVYVVERRLAQVGVVFAHWPFRTAAPIAAAWRNGWPREAFLLDECWSLVLTTRSWPAWPAARALPSCRPRCSITLYWAPRSSAIDCRQGYASTTRIWYGQVRQARLCKRSSTCYPGRVAVPGCRRMQLLRQFRSKRRKQLCVPFRGRNVNTRASESGALLAPAQRESRPRPRNVRECIASSDDSFREPCSKFRSWPPV